MIINDCSGICTPTVMLVWPGQPVVPPVYGNFGITLPACSPRGCLALNLATVTFLWLSLVVAVLQDFKTAHLLGVAPSSQLVAMLIGSAASVPLSVAAYQLYTSAWQVRRATSQRMLKAKDGCAWCGCGICTQQQLGRKQQEGPTCVLRQRGS